MIVTQSICDYCSSIEGIQKGAEKHAVFFATKNLFTLVEKGSSYINKYEQFNFCSKDCFLNFFEKNLDSNCELKITNIDENKDKDDDVPF